MKTRQLWLFCTFCWHINWIKKKSNHFNRTRTFFHIFSSSYFQTNHFIVLILFLLVFEWMSKYVRRNMITSTDFRILLLMNYNNNNMKKKTHIKWKYFYFLIYFIDLCVCNIVVWLSSVTIEVIAAFRVKQLFALKLSTQFSNWWRMIYCRLSETGTSTKSDRLDLCDRFIWMWHIFK